jgi:hypothetical protein
MSLNAPVAEPPFETRPAIVAPLAEVGAGVVFDGCAASGIAGDFDELHATAVTSPTTTAVSRTERGAVMWLVLVVRSPRRELVEATDHCGVRKPGAELPVLDDHRILR